MLIFININIGDEVFSKYYFVFSGDRCGLNDNFKNEDRCYDENFIFLRQVFGNEIGGECIGL